MRKVGGGGGFYGLEGRGGGGGLGGSKKWGEGGIADSGVAGMLTLWYTMLCSHGQYQDGRAR